MHTSHINIGLLGTGAIGSLMAYHWQYENLFALPRDKTSITAISVTHKEQTWNEQIKAWNNEVLDWLVVCTKATDTLSALNAWIEYLPNVKRLLLLQNGMGQHETCQAWIKENNLTCELWAGMSTEGAYKTDNTVVYAGSGETFIGPWLTSEKMEAFNELPNTKKIYNIQENLRQKLAVNAVINPLTAIFKCKNGELLSNIEYHKKFNELTSEIANLYTVLNWPLSGSLKNIVTNVAKITAQNKSSTLQDILHHRPTELAFICGYLLNQAHAHNIELPITQNLMLQMGA